MLVQTCRHRQKRDRYAVRHVILHCTHSDHISYSNTLVLQRWETPQEVAGALITPRVVVQIQLMVLFRIPPFPRWQDLRRNTTLPPLLVHLVGNVARNLLLLGIVVEDGRAILGTNIGSLAVLGGGIVHLVEELEKGTVGDFFGVVDYLQGFGVTSASTAHGSVPWVLAITANVSNARVVQALALVLPPVHVLDAPETSCGNGRGLRTRGYVHGLCGRIRHTAERAEEFSQKGHGKVGEEDEEEDCKELQIGVVLGCFAQQGRITLVRIVCCFLCI